MSTSSRIGVSTSLLKIGWEEGVLGQWTLGLSCTATLNFEGGGR